MILRIEAEHVFIRVQRVERFHRCSLHSKPLNCVTTTLQSDDADGVSALNIEFSESAVDIFGTINKSSLAFLNELAFDGEHHMKGAECH
jgi:hypothetical protein